MKHPYDLTQDIIKLCDVPEEDMKEIEEAVYQLSAIAQNEYNAEYWRVFYRTLSRIAENVDL